MRRYAPCLILLLAPLAGWASNRPSETEPGGCVYATSAAHGPAPDADPAPGHAAPRKPATTPATTQGGGGDGDVLLPRMRMPKWHSFLPGMFR